MEILLLTLALPLLTTWLIHLKWPTEITWKEWAVSALISVVVTGGVYAAGMFDQTYDQEVWSGEVTGKHQKRVSCEHSYCCGRDKDGNCNNTCYDHAWDYNWVVDSNIGDFKIRRIDRQGVKEPPRFTQIQLGDPVSDTHRFTNYVKAVPESLFHKVDIKQFDSMIPANPLEIYDYYKIDRVLSVGVPVPDLAAWNSDVSQLLRKLGPQKQANVVIVFANTNDQKYLHALEGKWLGGKKNDIIVVIGSSQYPKIDWVGVSSWTDKQLFKVKLRDDILAMQNIDRKQIITAIDTNATAMFQRKSMKDFEYLKYEIEPPVWVLTLAVILGILAAIGSSIYFYRNDPFGDSRSRYSYNRRFR